MKALDLIFAARPMLHLPGWSIFLVSLHYHHQLSGQRFSLEDFFVLLGITLMTAGAMYVNQVFDVKSDMINRKLGFVSRGYLGPRQMMAAFLVCSLAGLAIGPFISLVTTAIFLQAFALSWIYSAPPFRLKDRAFWGLFANAYSFGWLIALSVMPEINVHNAGQLGWDNPFYFFYVVAGVYCLTTLPDREGDAAAGKRTIAVAGGPLATRVVAMAFYLLACAVAIRSEYYLLACLVGVAVLLVLLNILRVNAFTAHPAAKVPIMVLSLMAGLLYPWYLVFMIVLLWSTRVYYKHRFNMVYPSLT